MCEDLGFSVDLNQMKRVWGEILPDVANQYDNAVERLAAVAALDPTDDHVLGAVDTAWRRAVGGYSHNNAVTLLQFMQLQLITTADTVKAAMEVYAANDTSIADMFGREIANLEEARDRFELMSGQPDPVVGHP